MKTIRLILNRPQSACDYYRTILPYRQLQKPLMDEGIRLEMAYNYATVQGGKAPDAIVFYRLVQPEVVVGLLALSGKGMALAWDTDDDFLSVPPWSPYRVDDTGASCFVAGRLMADHCWCATPILASRLSSQRFPGSKCPDFQVLPNLIDLNDWDGGIDHPTQEDSKTIRILWAGSNSHAGDLAMLERPLLEILKKYPNVMIDYFGEAPARWKAAWFKRLREIPWQPLDVYASTMCALKPHIGVAPLAAHEFNDCRSNLKWMEYTMAGAVTVASRNPAYQDCPGIVTAYADEQSWFESLARLIEDEQFRRGQYAASAAAVRERFSWQTDAKNAWSDAFKSLVIVKQ